MKGQQAEPPRPRPAESAWEACLEVTASIRAKADKSKRRARVSTIVAIGASSSIPIFLAFIEGNIVLRIIPSVMAALTVVVASWTGIERPHERWVLYRRYQRLLEAEQLRYEFGDPDEYAGNKTRDQKLAEYLARAQIDLHTEWEGLIPKSTSTQDTARTRDV